MTQEYNCLLAGHNDWSIFYYDSVVINTFMDVRELKNLLPVSELKKLCKRFKICEASSTAKSHGYRSRIEIGQARHDFFEMLKKYDIRAYRITYLEIACDIEFPTLEDAKDYKQWFRSHAVKRWTREPGCFECYAEWEHIAGTPKPLETLYLGKQKGKESKFYVRAYIPIKQKISNQPVFHIEFVISSADKIKRTLNVTEIADLKNPAMFFNNLQKRFLRVRKLNQKKIRRLIGLRYSHDILFDGVWDFREFLLKEQIAARRKHHLAQLYESVMRTKRRGNRKGEFFKRKFNKIQLDRYDWVIIKARLGNYLVHI